MTVSFVLASAFATAASTARLSAPSLASASATAAWTTRPRVSSLPVLSTSALPAGTIAAFVPDAIAAAFEGAPEVETSKHVALHYEDAAPLPIGSPGSPATVAAPTRNAFQHDVIAIKAAAKLTWAVAAPGGAQVISGATWGGAPAATRDAADEADEYDQEPPPRRRGGVRR